MERLFYYLEDADGGFVVDQNYMDYLYDENEATIIMVGTKEEILAHVNWLCNDNNNKGE